MILLLALPVNRLDVVRTPTQVWGQRTAPRPKWFYDICLLALPCNFDVFLLGKQRGYGRPYLHTSTPVFSSTARSSHTGSGFCGSACYKSSPFHTLWRCGVESPWVLSVNVRMESANELDVRVAWVLSQAPEVLTVYYLHVSTEVVWTCSAFYRVFKLKVDRILI
jgi:hypothetical protein